MSLLGILIFLFKILELVRIDKSKGLLQVNLMGRVSDIEVLSDVDKAFRRQVDYWLKKFPDSKPVHTFDIFGLKTFK